MCGNPHCGKLISDPLKGRIYCNDYCKQWGVQYKSKSCITCGKLLGMNSYKFCDKPCRLKDENKRRRKEWKLQTTI